MKLLTKVWQRKIINSSTLAQSWGSAKWACQAQPPLSSQILGPGQRVCLILGFAEALDYWGWGEGWQEARRFWTLSLGHSPVQTWYMLIITFLFSTAAQQGLMPFSWDQWPPVCCWTLLLRIPCWKAASGSRKWRCQCSRAWVASHCNHTVPKGSNGQDCRVLCRQNHKVKLWRGRHQGKGTWWLPRRYEDLGSDSQ